MSRTTHALIAIVSATEDLSEAVVSLLRKQGHAVRTDWFPNVKSTAGQFEKRQPEVTILQPASDTDLAALVAIRDAEARNHPVVIYDPQAEPETCAAMLAAGADAVAHDENLELLCQLVLKSLKLSKALASRSIAEEQLVKLARRHRNLMEETSEAVAYLQEGIHLRANSQYATVFGYGEPEDLLGAPLMDLVSKPDRDKIRTRLKKCEQGEKMDKAENFNGIAQDGTNVPLSLKLTKLESDSDIPQIEVLIPHEAPPAAFIPSENVGGGVHRGRTSLIAALNSLREYGTGSGICALVFFGLDNAQGMEERLGFMATDQICDELAAFVLDRVGESDRVFRFDNHRLALLLFRPNVQAAASAAEKIRESISNRSFGEGNKSTSLSVSGAIRPLGKMMDPEELLFDARRAVLRIQSSSEGTGLVLEEADDDPAQAGDDKMWLARVRDALENNSFQLAYQTISSLEGESDEFLDVFLRMVDDKGTEIMAGSFIPVAERHGLMPMVDQWVIKRAAAAARKRSTTGKNCVMLVRLSESTVVASETLLPWLKKFLDLHKGEPPHLTFTIKEQTLMDRYAIASHLVKSLRKMNCRCALSNFSGSKRAMELLNDVDLDFIKLQGSFTKALTTGEDDGKIAGIINEVTQRGVKVVAEQVEDATSMARLWQMGVHYVQGQETDTA